MILVIDNYDSFTYNLVQYLGELGAQPWVFRNDQITLGEIENMNPSHIVISPGPGHPSEDAGISNEVIRRFHGRAHILGVCLGHQCIGHVFGGTVDRAPRLMHGKTSRIIHRGGPLFAGIPNAFQATRYHSLVVEEPLPEGLEAIARTAEGELMALKHRDASTYGVQFHPESILTPHGKRLLRNYLDLGKAKASGLAVAASGGAQGAESALGISEALERVLAYDHLSTDEAEGLMMQVMGGDCTPAQIGALLAALRAKGETVDEITGFARAMRRHVTRVEPTREPLVDTCGTGGDGAHTFNISTTAALVVAGAGVAVAKHGNRAVSSSCGSADVLRALGVALEMTPAQVATCIDEIGFGFLFAPRHHPAMKHAIGPRREMGVRTVFNVLGPLTNPAGAGIQVMGVFDRALIEMLAEVLNGLGSQAAYVVSSADGLDEFSTTAPNHVATLHDGLVTRDVLDAESLGLARAPLSAIQGGDALKNAGITRDILAGGRGPKRDIVLLNAGMTLVAAGVASDPQEGIARAAESIDNGQAFAVLQRLIDYSQSAAATPPEVSP